ncbi:S-layer homology domain-containing protein [Pseudobacteroides cellulosolvens]|uniref:Di-glucose binding within endoplasmic reticulum n=1 Tax=Pseudobacteroides cellulosolvens ATCC 35603 = DSM 2933 TaxID=398512 RepID=A0A0L6JII6_9FIRM|nr:S-layer homology domain-containing protein [Pseudobacteroides cellulosolvens]KNY25540.1 Di-glucose binding within endoplasmic reticulum [Pseudobacteroides cellulosolvens ATCC 35603 = DSM 2933]
MYRKMVCILILSLAIVSQMVNTLKLVSESSASSAIPAFHATIRIDGDANEWSSLPSQQFQIAEGTGTIKSLHAIQDTSSLFLCAKVSQAPISKTYFYIDSDNNSDTGYHHSEWLHCGADYLYIAEDNALFKHTGSGYDDTFKSVEHQNPICMSSIGTHAVEVMIDLSVLVKSANGNMKISAVFDSENFAPCEGTEQALSTYTSQNQLHPRINIQPTPVPLYNVPFRIDTGSNWDYIDSQDNLWMADQGNTGGDVTDRGAIEISSSGNDRIYQTERYGMKSYNFNVTNGWYEVHLHFAETFSYIEEKGKRLFDVTVEDKTLSGLDVFNEAGGRNIALMKKFCVNVTDNQLNIMFTPLIENAMINGIEVLNYTPTPCPTQTPTQTVTQTPTQIATSTPTVIPTATSTATSTPTMIPTATSTATSTPTAIPTPTSTATSTPTVIRTNTTTSSSSSIWTETQYSKTTSTPTTSTPTTSTPTTTPIPTTTLIPTTMPTITKMTALPTAKPTPIPAIISEPMQSKKPYTAISDIENHWAKEHILKLFNKGYIRGYEDKTFRPDNYITRNETAVIIAKAAKLDSIEDSEIYFRDRDTIPVWVKPFLSIIVDVKFLKGYEDNTFRGDNNLTRAEAATIFTNMICTKKKIPFPKESQNNMSAKLIKFKDFNAAHWANPYLNTLIENGMLTGYPDGTIRPEKKVTRAEFSTMCSLLINLLEYKE